METKTIKSVVSRFVTASKKVDSISKEIFTLITEEYNKQLATGVKNKEIKTVISKEFLEALKDDDNKIKSRLKKIVDISISFNSYKLVEFIKEETLLKLHFNRIEAIVKLVVFLQDNEEQTKGAFQELKDLLATSFALCSKTINNAIDKDISSIKQKYNIKGEEDDLEFKGTLQDFISMGIAKFSKEELLKALQEA